jgi:hypothetical protein
MVSPDSWVPVMVYLAIGGWALKRLTGSTKPERRRPPCAEVEFENGTTIESSSSEEYEREDTKLRNRYIGESLLYALLYLAPFLLSMISILLFLLNRVYSLHLLLLSFILLIASALVEKIRE